jgi:nucleotide-binding universal stress UspA family protein
MQFRDFLVVVDSSKASDNRVELAASLAGEHGGHLVGLYVLPIPEPNRHLRPTFFDAIIDLCIRKEKELSREARRKFEDAINRHGVKGEWRTAGGFPSEEAAVHVRYVDLGIVGQLDPSIRGGVMPPLLPEDVALSAGRPILITPVSWTPRKIGKRIIVAWNAQREATRAVNDAIPILTNADSVIVLVIDPEKRIMSPHGEEPGADIALHLARHGIKAEVEVAVSDVSGPTDVLHSKTRELAADLIVMGAYGHARTRELVLGGFTRDLLQHMDVPVFMSH